MKRQVVLGTVLALSLAVIFLSVCFAPVLAVTIHIEHNTQGASIFNVPGHPSITIIGQHYYESDFYEGSADKIQLAVSGALSGIGPPFKVVASYEDNPARYAFSLLVAESAGSTSINLVKRDQIQIFRIGKTVFVYWTKPLVMPATSADKLGPATPAVTLPPGCFVVQGSGDVKIRDNIVPYGLWALHQQYTGYDGVSTLLCPGWRYIGPGVQEWNLPSIRTEATFTWTGP